MDPKVVTEEVTTTTGAPLTAEQEAQEDADFAAGVTEVRGDKLHTDDRPNEAEPLATDSPEKATEPEPENKTPPEDPEVFPGMKRSQVLAAMEAAGRVGELEKLVTNVRDQAMGHIGQFKQALEALKKDPATGKPRKITPEMLKRTFADYDELAPLLAEDLSELGLGGAVVDQEAIEKIVNDRMEARAAEISKATEVKLLTVRHKDWREISKSPDFTEWRKTLPEEANTILDTSEDGMELGDAFDDYKAWIANGKKAPGEAPPPKPDPEAQDKEKRLAANVAPKTTGKTGSALLSEDEAFEAGVNEVRKRRVPGG